MKEPHIPIDCETLEKWLEKIDTEDASSVWVARNTKKCPKCSSPVIKNGGCNHITCGSCGTGFCWLCLGDKTTHGGTDEHINQCNNLADAMRRGAKFDNLKTEKLQKHEEFERMRLDWYKYRYKSH